MLWSVGVVVRSHRQVCRTVPLTPEEQAEEARRLFWSDVRCEVLKAFTYIVVPTFPIIGAIVGVLAVHYFLR
jgi:hypothetical protein